MHLPAALSVAKTLLERGDYRACRRLLTDALAHHAGQPDVHHGLGLALHGLGLPDDSLASLRQALALSPQHAEAHFTQAVVLLSEGRYAEGFAEYEWRTLRTGAHQRRFYKGRVRWEGQPLRDDGLLIHCEQGLGDALQFVRYLPRVQERVGRVFLACRTELKRLFAASFLGLAGIVAGDDPLPPEARYHCPLLSLPHIFETAWETVPAQIPYLAGPAPCPVSVPPRIGLAWRANPASVTGAARSLRLTDLLPLSDLPARWISLQHDPTDNERNILTHLFSAEERGSQCPDFAATADALADVDLVICPDTALAHLAGALGKPVWTLLPTPTSWRWGPTRADTPWYPTMTLFRQAVPRDWGAPVAEIARQVKNRFPMS